MFVRTVGFRNPSPSSENYKHVLPKIGVMDVDCVPGNPHALVWDGARFALRATLRVRVRDRVRVRVRLGQVGQSIHRKRIQWAPGVKKRQVGLRAQSLILRAGTS